MLSGYRLDLVFGDQAAPDLPLKIPHGFERLGLVDSSIAARLEGLYRELRSRASR